MKERMDIGQVEPRIYKAMDEAEKQLSTFKLDKKLVELIKLRVSQMNGCGYCVDMHSKDARKAGESEQRVFAVCVWWETPFFTEKEQSALKLAEEVTEISKEGVSEETYQKALEHFGETEIAQLIFTAVVTNGWNRLCISTHLVAGQD